MFRQIKKFMLVAIAVGVVMSWAVPAIGGIQGKRKFEHGERYENKTGSDAYCLRKILYKWTIDPASAESDQFAKCNVTKTGDYHLIECKVGEVPYTETAIVTFSGTSRDGTAEVVCAKWYSDPDCGYLSFIGYATLVGSTRPDEELNRGPLLIDVDIVVKHKASHWDDTTEQRVYTAETVSGSEIYFAEWRGYLHHSDMTEILWTCVDASSNPPPAPLQRTECLNDGDCTVAPYLYCGRFDPGKEGGPGGIDWYPPSTGPTSFTLIPEQEAGPFHLGTYKGTDRLLFRFYNVANNYIYGTTDYEVVQFRVRDWFIPTVSEWGLVVIALLVLAAGTIVIRRRRAMAAQA